MFRVATPAGMAHVTLARTSDCWLPMADGFFVPRGDCTWNGVPLYLNYSPVCPLRVIGISGVIESRVSPAGWMELDRAHLHRWDLSPPLGSGAADQWKCGIVSSVCPRCGFNSVRTRACFEAWGSASWCARCDLHYFDLVVNLPRRDLGL
jgi:hypothetical protein